MAAQPCHMPRNSSGCARAQVGRQGTFAKRTAAHLMSGATPPFMCCTKKSHMPRSGLRYSSLAVAMTSCIWGACTVCLLQIPVWFGCEKDRLGLRCLSLLNATLAIHTRLGAASLSADAQPTCLDRHLRPLPVSAPLSLYPRISLFANQLACTGTSGPCRFQPHSPCTQESASLQTNLPAPAPPAPAGFSPTLPVPKNQPLCKPTCLHRHLWTLAVERSHHLVGAAAHLHGNIAIVSAATD